MIENRDIYDPTKYRNLIYKIANRFFVDDDTRKDLIQEGFIAVYRASLKHDDTKGPFFNYAQTAIINRMNSWMKRYANTVRVPVKLIEDKDEEIMYSVSIDTPINDFGDTLETLLPSEVKEYKDEYTHLYMALKCLKIEQREIVEMKYGLVPGTEPLTLSEIGEKLNVSDETIRQRLLIIMKKLNKVLTKYDKN